MNFFIGGRFQHGRLIVVLFQICFDGEGPDNSIKYYPLKTQTDSEAVYFGLHSAHHCPRNSTEGGAASLLGHKTETMHFFDHKGNLS